MVNFIIGKAAEVGIAYLAHRVSALNLTLEQGSYPNPISNRSEDEEEPFGKAKDDSCQVTTDHHQHF
jgi:hypothetical protein